MNQWFCSMTGYTVQQKCMNFMYRAFPARVESGFD